MYLIPNAIVADSPDIAVRRFFGPHQVLTYILLFTSYRLTQLQ